MNFINLKTNIKQFFIDLINDRILQIAQKCQWHKIEGKLRNISYWILEL